MIMHCSSEGVDDNQPAYLTRLSACLPCSAMNLREVVAVACPFSLDADGPRIPTSFALVGRHDTHLRRGEVGGFVQQSFK